MIQRVEITDLTVCRAFFAAWVFAYHVDLHAQFAAQLGPFAGFIRHGYLGVDGFFILSGLILARLHPELAARGGLAWQFWGKRLARIYPVHLAVIIILAVLVVTGLALGLSARSPERFTLAGLLANLALLQGWGLGPSLSPPLGWNYPSWSISTEWAGYLAFPFLWRFLGSTRPIIPGQILLLCFPVLGLISHLSGDTLNLTNAMALPRFFLEFIIGMTTMRLVPLNADVMPNRFLAIFASLAVVFLASFRDDILVIIALWLLLAALMMRADATQPPVISKPGFLLFLGRISYSFYMSFGTSELLLAQFYRHQGWSPASGKLIYITGMCLITLALAVALHVLVETPARRWADSKLAPPGLAPAGQPR